MPKIPKIPKTVFQMRAKSIKVLPPRSEILALDSYTNDRTGINTRTNADKLAVIHAIKLKELDIVNDFADFNDPQEIDEADIVIPWYHLCDSYDNPAMFCVYHNEDHSECCLYCGNPQVRQ